MSSLSWCYPDPRSFQIPGCLLHPPAIAEKPELLSYLTEKPRYIHSYFFSVARNNLLEEGGFAVLFAFSFFWNSLSVVQSLASGGASWMGQR